MVLVYINRSNLNVLLLYLIWLKKKILELEEEIVKGLKELEI
jgi:hypothetical protein